MIERRRERRRRRRRRRRQLSLFFNADTRRRGARSVRAGDRARDVTFAASSAACAVGGGRRPSARERGSAGWCGWTGRTGTRPRAGARERVRRVSSSDVDNARETRTRPKMGWEGVDDAADGRTPRRAARVGDAAGEERRTSVRREEEEEDDDDARGMEASDAPWLPRGVMRRAGKDTLRPVKNGPREESAERTRTHTLWVFSTKVPSYAFSLSTTLKSELLLRKESSSCTGFSRRRGGDARARGPSARPR